LRKKKKKKKKPGGHGTYRISGANPRQVSEVKGRPAKTLFKFSYVMIKAAAGRAGLHLMRQV